MDHVDEDGPEGLPLWALHLPTTDAAGDIRFIVHPRRVAGVKWALSHRPWDSHFAYLDALDRSLSLAPRRTVVLVRFTSGSRERHQPYKVF